MVSECKQSVKIKFGRPWHCKHNFCYSFADQRCPVSVLNRKSCNERKYVVRQHDFVSHFTPFALQQAKGLHDDFMGEFLKENRSQLPPVRSRVKVPLVWLRRLRDAHSFDHMFSLNLVSQFRYCASSFSSITHFGTKFRPTDGSQEDGKIVTSVGCADVWNNGAEADDLNVSSVVLRELTKIERIIKPSIEHGVEFFVMIFHQSDGLEVVYPRFYLQVRPASRNVRTLTHFCFRRCNSTSMPPSRKMFCLVFPCVCTHPFVYRRTLCMWCTGSLPARRPCRCSSTR